VPAFRYACSLHLFLFHIPCTHCSFRFILTCSTSRKFSQVIALVSFIQEVPDSGLGLCYWLSWRSIFVVSFILFRKMPRKCPKLCHDHFFPYLVQLIYNINIYYSRARIAQSVWRRATGWTAGVRFPAGARFFLLSIASRPALASTHRPM
jgi:hypothetical protein